MSGWHMSVYRFGEPPPPEASPDDLTGLLDAMADARTARVGGRLAAWQATVDGADWLHDLVAAGRAAVSLGAGYPDRFCAKARDVLPQIENMAPPHSRDVWVAGATDLLTPQWEGRTTLAGDELAQCGPQDWLYIEVWDES